jgi:hypothetical protein
MSFYVHIPSNTRVEGNKTHTFKVRLARKLEFRSEWSVGLAVFSYPHTWPALGAMGIEEFIQVKWTNGTESTISLQPSNLSSPFDLMERLNLAIKSITRQQLKELGQLLNSVSNLREATSKDVSSRMEQKKREILARSHRIETNLSVANTYRRDEESNKALEKELTTDDDGTALFLRLFSLELRAQLDSTALEWLRRCARNPAELGVEEDLVYWLKVYEDIGEKCEFSFSSQSQRYTLRFNSECIRAVVLSEQLAFILGFPQNKMASANGSHDSAAVQLREQDVVVVHEAKFSPDLSGGVSSLYVYAPGLIEPMLIGDCCAPLMRIAIVRGEPDEVIEDTYVAIQYHRLLTKEVSEIEIRICSANGEPMPFQYGNCVLTLHFKKTPYF